MDIFVEQLVKKEKTVRDRLITVCIVLCVVLLPLACVALAYITSIYYFIMVAFFVLIAAVYGAWYFITAQNVEYEYSVTNSNLRWIRSSPSARESVSSASILKRLRKWENLTIRITKNASMTS